MAISAKNALHRFRQTSKIGLVCSFSAALVLQGCDEQIMLSDSAVSRDDACSQYRATISEARKSDIQQQQTAAAAGAIFGALLGAATSDSDNRTQAMLLGAAAGGLIGYSATYYNQKAKRAADSRSLLASVNTDAAAERTLVTRTGQAAQALRSCRINELRSLRTKIRGGQIEQGAARRELSLIRSRVANDNRIISAAFNGINQRVSAYVDATDQVAKADAAISRQSARSATPSVARVSSESNSRLGQDQAAKQRIESLSAEIDALLS